MTIGANGQISIAPNTQPFLSRGITEYWDYPTVAVTGTGKIMIGVSNIYESQLLSLTNIYFPYLTAASLYTQPDGTIVFGLPRTIPAPSGVPYDNVARAVGKYNSFSLFMPIRTNANRATSDTWAIDRYDSQDGVNWTGPTGIASFSPPKQQSSGIYPAFPGTSYPGSRRVFLAPILDARGSQVGEDYFLAFPVLNNSFNNYVLCSPTACGVMDPQAQDQFLGGVTITNAPPIEDGWLSYLSTNSAGTVDAKALYRMQNGGWMIATYWPGLNPGTWLPDTDRCTGSGCWSLGDYVHSAGVPDKRAMTLFPAPNCSVFSPGGYAYCVQTTPQRLQSALLQDPPASNLPNYQPNTIHFKPGTDLRTILPAGDRGPSDTTPHRFERFAPPIRAEALTRCVPPGPLSAIDRWRCPQ